MHFRVNNGWTLKDWDRDSLLPWVCSLVFEGDDEPGDPSGLHLILFGYIIEAYWPMHRKFFVTWQLGQLPKLHRW